MSAWAATYYVSSSTGNDANNGTSSSTAWQTLGKVNATALQPGDVVMLKRGDVWNESLAPSGSGVSGNPIAFDAYGTGAAPNLTGYYAVPSNAWVNLGNNAWKAPVPATYTTINFCLFGSIWGQKVGAATSNLTAQQNFYFANGFVYVYAVGNPATYYNATIAPMGLSNVPVINVNGKSWLTFQHLLLNWFDQYGVYVQGASDHLVFANMEADAMIPQGTQPLGFYVNASGAGPGDIKIYNSEAHMNYDGFRFDGAATAITLVNDKAYANRDGALVDNTGAVTYSNCHFYASSLAVAGSTDVLATSGSGATAGAGNIGTDVAPVVQAWQRYPARVTLTVDDVGMTPGADNYYANTVLPTADTAGVPVGVAITVGYSATINPIVSVIQGWITAGRDVTSHSMSHTYYTNTDALEIQYTGSGTAAALNIVNKTLTITVTGAADSVSYNLAQGQAQGTIKGLRQALLATGNYTATESATCQGSYGTGCSINTEAALLAQDLADVSGQDVKSAVYHAQLDVPRLTTDEITLSRQWMTSHLSGLPATPVYVYPGGYETTTMQGITAAVPYSGGRGALKEDLGVKDTYASGFNVQDITSLGVNPSWQLLAPAALNQKVQALLWKEQVWGVPWGIFWHLNELSGTEVTNLISDLKNGGATIQTNTGLVNWLLGGTQVSGTDGNAYYKSGATTSAALDFRPTKNSPVVDAGQNLGTSYAIDINGANQNSYGSGWEIGAHVFAGYATYGGTSGSGQFHIGGLNGTQVNLPQSWVNTNEWVGTTTSTISFPTSGTGGGWVCGTTNYGPYTANSLASANQAVADAESCRAANGSGTLILFPAGALLSGTGGLTLRQTAGDTSSNFVVLASAAPLPPGQTVCAHDIRDAGTNQNAHRNLGCASPNDVSSMWTVEYTAANPGILSGAADANGIGPHHFAIINAEVRPQAGNTNSVSPIKIGTWAETSSAQMPSHIHLIGNYVHGDWTDYNGTAVTGTNNIVYDFAFNSCIYCSISYNYADKSLRPGAEGHGIQLGYAQQIKIVHNWFEGNSIHGAFCGGQASNLTLTGFLGCTDVEDRANRYTYPASWMAAAQAGVKPNGGSNGFVNKNAEELKNALRYVRDGNVYENVDNSGAQNGTVFTAKTAQCSAGALCSNYWIATNDLTFTNNLFRNACNGPSMGAMGSTIDGGGVTLGVGRINFSNNLGYNLGYQNNACAGAGPTNPYGLRVTTGDQTWGTTVAGQTTACAGTADGIGNETITCTGAPGQSQLNFVTGQHVLVTSCSDATFNTTTSQLGPAAQATTPGSLSVTIANPGVTATGSATGCILHNLAGTPGGVSVTHNTILASGGPTGAASFYNDISQTTDEFATGQTWQNNLFLAYWPESSQGGGFTSANGEGTRTVGQVFDAGSLSFNSNVIAGRALKGTVNCSSSSHNCTLVSGDAPNAQGARMNGENVLVNGVSYPVTGVSASAITFSTTNNPGTLTNGSYVWSDYTEYAGANNGVQPGPTIFTPTNVNCIGNDATAESCAGLWGAMGTSAYPLNLADWHGYRLCHTGDASCNGNASPFATGGAQQAADGNDQGANLGAIDTAQIATQYQCSTPCGAGAFQDYPALYLFQGKGGYRGSTWPDVVTYLQTTSNTVIAGATIEMYWSDFDNGSSGAIAVVNGSTAATVNCSTGCGNQTSWTGALIGGQWYEFSSTSGNSVVLVLPYAAATNGAAVFNAYNFSYQDSLAAPWVAAGKVVNWTLHAVPYTKEETCNTANANSYGLANVGNCATPAYVWTAIGASNYVSGLSTDGVGCQPGGAGGSGINQQTPNWMNATFSTYWRNAKLATVSHYAGVPWVRYIRIGMGQGGESFPSPAWQNPGTLCLTAFQTWLGSTNPTTELQNWTNNYIVPEVQWEGGMQTAVAVRMGRSPVILASFNAVGNSNYLPDTAAPVAAANHIGLGNQGLQAGDVGNCAGANADWCDNATAFANQVPTQLQTFDQSCPVGATGCSSAAAQTGALPALLTFAAKNHVTILELYQGDWLAAYDPASAYYPTYGAVYAQALQQTASGGNSR